MKLLQLQGGSGEEGISSPGLVITQSNEKRKRRAGNSEDEMEKKPVGQVWESVKPRGGAPSPITRGKEPGHGLGGHPLGATEHSGSGSTDGLRRFH